MARQQRRSRSIGRKRGIRPLAHEAARNYSFFFFALGFLALCLVFSALLSALLALLFDSAFAFFCRLPFVRRRLGFFQPSAAFGRIEEEDFRSTFLSLTSIRLTQEIDHLVLEQGTRTSAIAWGLLL